MARESNDPTAEILSALRGEYGAVLKELDYVKTCNEDLQQELEAQEAALKEYQEKCTHYQQHLQNEAESWKTKYEEKESEIRYLQSELDCAATDKSALKARLNELEMDCKLKDTSITSLSTDLDERGRLVDKLREQCSDLDAKLAADKENSQLSVSFTSRVLQLESYLKECKAGLQPYLLPCSEK